MNVYYIVNVYFINFTQKNENNHFKIPLNYILNKYAKNKLDLELELMENNFI